MRNKRRFMIGCTLLLSLIIGSYYYKALSPNNVFDEMYHIERKTIKEQKKIGFANMENIRNKSRELVTYDGNMINEHYKKSVLNEGESISFLFLYDDQELHITYSKELKKDIFLMIRYQYKNEENQLNQFITINDEQLPETFTVKEIEQIKGYLKTYKITEKELKSTAHNVLYKRVLPDWFEANDSKFTIEDLGSVKFKKDSFLK
ncbi:TipC family immunity protein [Aciduricibacillus chroicocephali]|uniref:TipC family immunity protein n=1 Tax=Aciduricibacillus chroicocephali TaxID=3054939 RepID=A0ABY9L048_9BACI|nr:TipC family immunity protein [Bacillaceae bacterium 44XB]